MADLIGRLARKKSVGYSEGKGLNLAVQTVEGFNERTFKCRNKKSRYSGISSEEIRRFTQEELPGYYNCYVRAKTWLDIQNTSQAEIQIYGIIGTRGKSSRYNPLDRTFVIRNE